MISSRHPYRRRHRAISFMLVCALMVAMQRLAWALLGFVITYAVVAWVRYAWAHPTLTERELLLHFFDAMLWR